MPRNNTGPRNNNNFEPFETFFQRWLMQQERFLQELLTHINENNEFCQDEEAEQRIKGLINCVMSHYNQYYDAKSRVAQENVFLLFSPSWFSSFERTFLWITGFKPGLAFGITTNYVSDLTEAQSQAVGVLKTEIKAKEGELSEELARVQETVAAPPILELARRAAAPVDGELADMNSSIEALAAAMEVLVVAADYLRGKTMLKIMEILNSAQTVRFLASAAQLQLQIRRYGLERDARRRGGGGGGGGGGGSGT